MDKCIYAIGKDFKVAMYEYDEENNRIGAQCSKKKTVSIGHKAIRLINCS